MDVRWVYVVLALVIILLTIGLLAPLLPSAEGRHLGTPKHTTFESAACSLIPECRNLPMIARVIQSSRGQEDTVPDNKSKRGGGDRNRVAVGEGYEVNYFAKKHGLSAQQARYLIAKVGNDRAELNKAAGKIKGQRGAN